jgi:hypothetical protein
VTLGVVGHAGLSPGMVKVVGRMSTVVVHPSGGGFNGPMHVMGRAQGGTSQTVEVEHGGQAERGLMFRAVVLSVC